MFENANWYIFDSLSSTNTRAQELVSEQSPGEGSVIMARYQEQGKGQRGNSWHSQPGKNVLMSTVLYPVFLPTSRLFLISKITALAMYDLAVEMEARDVKIKWPNDIYAGNKKLAGILIENTFRSSEIAMAIAGTGINVNQTEFDSDSGQITSLALETGRINDIKSVAESAHKHIAWWYGQLKLKNFTHIDSYYQQRMFRLNTEATFSENNIPFTGTIKGVNHAGKLLMEYQSGAIREFDLKEVKFVI